MAAGKEYLGFGIYWYAELWNLALAHYTRMPSVLHDHGWSHCLNHSFKRFQKQLRRIETASFLQPDKCSATAVFCISCRATCAVEGWKQKHQYQSCICQCSHCSFAVWWSVLPDASREIRWWNYTSEMLTVSRRKVREVTSGVFNSAVSQQEWTDGKWSKTLFGQIELKHKYQRVEKNGRSIASICQFLIRSHPSKEMWIRGILIFLRHSQSVEKSHSATDVGVECGRLPTTSPFQVTGDRFFAKGVAYNPRNELWRCIQRGERHAAIMDSFLLESQEHVEMVCPNCVYIIYMNTIWYTTICVYIYI